MKEKNTEKFISLENDRELLRKRAEKLALNVATADFDEKKDSSTKDYLLFNTGGDVYAFETVIVKEVHEPEEILPVPCTPEFLRGVISVRGNIWAVVDLCVFFGSGKSVSPSSSKVLLISSAESELGVVIDEVIDVIPISGAELKPNPAGKASESRYTLGITGDRKTILDGHLLLHDEAFAINEFVGSI